MANGWISPKMMKINSKAYFYVSKRCTKCPEQNECLVEIKSVQTEIPLKELQLCYREKILETD